jgi:hypothetical protein
VALAFEEACVCFHRDFPGAVAAAGALAGGLARAVPGVLAAALLGGGSVVALGGTLVDVAGALAGALTGVSAATLTYSDDVSLMQQHLQQPYHCAVR